MKRQSVTAALGVLILLCGFRFGARPIETILLTHSKN